MAIAPDGTVHVVWAGADGIYHSTTAPGEASEVEQVYDYGTALVFAGPIGRPSVALDGAGAPWVAFGVNGGPDDVEIVVATPTGDRWEHETVATVDRCNGCPPPLPTGITTVGEAPVVVFVDPAGAVGSARLVGEDWVEAPVDDAAAAGLAVSTDGDTATPPTTGRTARSCSRRRSDGTWTTTEVADATFPDVTSGLTAPTTDVAGGVAVAWQDEDGVHLATGDGGDLTTEETPTTEGGVSPSVAVAENGTIALAWVNPDHVNLMLGILGDPESIVVANPSPAPIVSLAPPSSSEPCGEDGTVDLEIAGSGSTFVDGKSCLVGPANEKFTVTFDILDGTHNFEVYDDAPADGGTLIDGTEQATGPVVQELPLEPLDAADYYFQCVVHPTTMAGTLAVVKGAK